MHGGTWALKTNKTCYLVVAKTQKIVPNLRTTLGGEKHKKIVKL